jgi:hypothetical protein
MTRVSRLVVSIAVAAVIAPVALASGAGTDTRVKRAF